MSNNNTAYFSSPISNRLSEEDQENGAICIANISPFERRKRWKFAIYQFIFTLAVLALFIVLGLHPLWRLPLFFLFSAATTSYFQARDKT
jgi:hypothetical protein